MKLIVVEESLVDGESGIGREVYRYSIGGSLEEMIFTQVLVLNASENRKKN